LFHVIFVGITLCDTMISIYGGFSLYYVISDITSKIIINGCYSISRDYSKNLII